MKVKLSLGPIYRANDAISRFADNTFMINETFRIIKMKKILQKEYDLIDEQRANLVKKYIPEGSNLTQVPQDRFQEFQQEFVQFLFSEVIEIDIPNKIDAKSIMESNTIKVTPQDLVDISFFIDGIEEYIEIIEDKSDESENIVDFTKSDDTQ